METVAVSELKRGDIIVFDSDTKMMRHGFYTPRGARNEWIYSVRKKTTLRSPNKMVRSRRIELRVVEFLKKQHIVFELEKSQRVFRFASAEEAKRYALLEGV